MQIRRFVFGACAVLLGAVAHAEVKLSAPDGILITISAPLAASTPAKTYSALVQPQHWWSGEHTWSGKAENLSLKPEAGGCFCERWAGGSVEHGRVVMAVPERMLRLDASLGPLQALAVKGVLSFVIQQNEIGKTTLDVEYRVNGASVSGLDKYTRDVSEVLTMQVLRLQRFIDSGNPEAPPAAPAVTDAGTREAILEAWKQSAEQQAVDDKTAAPATKKPKPATDGRR